MLARPGDLAQVDFEWGRENNTVDMSNHCIQKFAVGVLGWKQININGFGDRQNSLIMSLTPFGGQLYAGTYNTSGIGAQLWRESEGGDWTRVVTNGFGDVSNVSVVSFEVFNGRLYGGTWNGTTGGEVQRTSDGMTWTQVNDDGFGDSKNFVVSSLAVFDGHLYAAVGHWAEPWNFGSFDGIQLWRCHVCDGSDWTKTVDNSFWPASTGEQSALQVFDGQLYLVVGNRITGMQVWHTIDGTNWEQVGFAGFGDSNNVEPRWDNSVTLFNGSLYIGTWNDASGGEVWQRLHEVFLPLVLRSE